MASHHPAQPKLQIAGTTTGRPAAAKATWNDPKNIEQTSTRPAQTENYKAISSIDQQSLRPVPANTLFGILACELEAHSLRLISR
jgi:hypothetical protein